LSSAAARVKLFALATASNTNRDFSDGIFDLRAIT